MWAKGYQVIISYDEVSELTKHFELWPAIPYWWGNKSTTKALIQYLEHMKKMGRPGITHILFKKQGISRNSKLSIPNVGNVIPILCQSVQTSSLMVSPNMY